MFPNRTGVRAGYAALTEFPVGTPAFGPSCTHRVFSATPGEQAHGDDGVSIRTKRKPKIRHGATLQYCGHDCDRKDADREIGGPRYPILGNPCTLRLNMLTNDDKGAINTYKAVSALERAARERLRSASQQELQTADALLWRAFESNCQWCHKHQNDLVMLALTPQQAQRTFRIWERIHRALYHRKRLAQR
jgi:hypothetical protein